MTTLATDLVLDIGRLLTDRGDTVSIAESSSGGLVAARLLAVPGASMYFLGGSVVYTLPSRRAYLDVRREDVEGIAPLSADMAAVFARSAREKLSATWGIAELGAAGPTGSRYGHDAGTTAIGIDGPLNHSLVSKTGHSDRGQNMWDFSESVLKAFLATLQRV